MHVIFHVHIHFTCGTPRACGAFHASASGGGPLIFQVLFTDQSIPFAELRTINFAFLGIPPLDYWPFDFPVHGHLNLELHHFRIACISLYRPGGTFCTVDTPSLAPSLASDLP